MKKQARRRTNLLLTRQIALANESAVDARYEHLRQWRNALARKKEIRPFKILSNRVLRLVAAAEPTSGAELLAVKGIGPVKLEQYGKRLLGKLSEHRKAH